MGCGEEKLSKHLTQTFTAHCNAMICQQVTLSGNAEWPKVADAMIEAALQRIFQLLRDEIDHPLPPYTAVLWEEEPSPTSKKEKPFTKRGQALRLCLRPGSHITPSNIRTHARGSMHMEICEAF